ncbi:hypothetical protein [Roseimicrobium sp. ORNL1]|uniref:hypothetical protein n=1 Tax=Roseimicrobium sp. ORNL1 TaxID=2711231 RepID=UPI0013E1F37F|nr:hypothetical protein [Roseimicrobium sp. ORNL1]QIF00192.1 hypothetical protein G5S37_01190 [Roseimicrobium sp. ORNL1]
MSPSPRHVPIWVNYLMYFGLLLGALWLTVPDLRAIEIVYLFPIGILFFVGTQSTAMMSVAYGMHFVFFVLFALIRRSPGVYVLWTVFALYLLLNVKGCKEILEGVSRIH